MRAAHRAGASFTSLAHQYGVARSTAARAVRGERWANIDEARKRGIPVEVHAPETAATQPKLDA
jgi:hypothetical protein